jgi:hypothetical protein
MRRPPDPLFSVANFQYSITKEIIWPLMEVMGSTSPSSYSTVLELDKKLRDLSAAMNIFEDEQFNTTAAALEWSCILGANLRQAGEYFCSICLYAFLFPLAHTLSEISVSDTCGLRGRFPSSRSQLRCFVEWFELTEVVLFWILISCVVDAPPIPCHGAPSAP